jgi:osmotically-inducible protein OsmY
VHGARIGVEVSDGVVTLVGDLSTYAEKWAAERAAQRVAGVKALATSLKVQLTGPRRHSDADIAHAAENVLDWNATLPAGAVKLMVEGGWVTLTGEVDWHYQRQAAVASVRHLFGVTA